MPSMISLRRFRLTSLSGYTYQFEPNVPMNVHKHAVQEAMAQGCVPATDGDVPTFDDNRKVHLDYENDLRRSMVYLAIKTIVEENSIKDFDGAGMPKRTVVSERIGSEVHAKELVDVFQQFTQAEAEGRQFQLHESAPHVLRVIEAHGLADLLALAEEFGDEKASFKGASARDVRRSLLNKFTGVNLG